MSVLPRISESFVKLHLLRHPPPQIAAGVCYGQSDIAVDDNQMQKSASYVRHYFAERLALPLIISSPLQRCAKLALVLDPQFITDTRLQELHFGSWEMCAWNDIARNEIDAWAADTCNYRCGDGENVISFAVRVIDFIQQYTAQKNTDEYLLITHAGTIRLLLAYEHNISAQQLAARVTAQPRSVAFNEIITLCDFVL